MSDQLHERDRFACAWLRELMAGALITKGDVEGSHGYFKVE